jgi:hypothetical protein
MVFGEVQLQLFGGEHGAADPSLPKIASELAAREGL